MSEARETTQWSEREFCRNRYYNFLGSDQPGTIAAKEICDNTTDQVSDGKTNFGYFEIGSDLHSITAVDGGAGISMRKTIRQDTKEESTFLYLAVAKLYSSTNYDDENNANTTVGQNGLGTKLNNFLSHNFTCGVIAQHPQKHSSHKITNAKTADSDAFKRIYVKPEDGFVAGKIKGYHFEDGYPTLGDEPIDQANPVWMDVNVPLFYGQDVPFGYFVHAEYDTEILGDDINVAWVKNYLKTKISQAKVTNKDVCFTFVYPETIDGKTVKTKITYVKPVDTVAFAKEHKKEIANGSVEIIYDWETIVTKLVADNPDDAWGPIKSGYYSVVFVKDAKLLDGIPNIAQGTVVENNKAISYGYTIGQNKINVPVYCVFSLSAANAKGLTYADQTKRKLQSNSKTPAKLHLNNLTNAFEHCPDAKNYFETVASSKALGSNKKIRSDAYWPANGGKTARQYFSYGVKTAKDLTRIIKQVRTDDDAIAYCQEQGWDFDKLAKGKFDTTKDKVIELLMAANGLKKEEFDEEYKVLYICEGHSASSGIRTKRDPDVVGVLALRGKILNCWGRTLSTAMRSEVVKEYMTIMKNLNTSYNRVIVATDADPDGAHISSLLIALTAKFLPDLIKEGRFLLCDTPFYTFKQGGNTIFWGNSKVMYPEDIKEYADALTDAAVKKFETESGHTIKEVFSGNFEGSADFEKTMFLLQNSCKITGKDCKGLGSYNYDEIVKFILYPSMGMTATALEYDRNYKAALDTSMLHGCKEWIIIDDDANRYGELSTVSIEDID